ncbi:MAG: PAS domain S-box protein [Limnohabitans sp.]|nr:PAS domain S-box protein [Limnohabitans sp.]
MTWHLYFMRRWVLWGLLVALVATLLGALVWLAWRYELSQVQDRLDRETIEAVGDIRSGLNRNTQSLQALQALDKTIDDWRNDATLFLRQHRELVRLELREPDLKTKLFIESPFRLGVFDRYGTDSAASQTVSACNIGKRLSGPAYANSNYISQTDGAGLEIMDFCMPIVVKGQLTGYVAASYSLLDILSEMVSPQYTKTQQISFVESDGTRLAMQGMQQTARRTFVSQQLLDLPGHTMVVKLESWRATPDFFPNVLTAIVLLLALSLITVLFLLARDMRRRQRAELNLADALAFRKAMEDSLVTGLRARDNQGRITYVNPAFCEMVGLPVDQLLGQAIPEPYWPPEMVSEYGQRQALRLAGNAPPRKGVESVFMRQNGERFPVLIFEAPLLNTQDEQTGWMSAVLDSSEQRRTEELHRASMERLQATARLATVGEMASMLSHELNQPLAAILSYATGPINILENPLPDSQQLSHALSGAMHHIAHQAERAGQVIKSVQDFVRRQDQAREKVAPIHLIQNIMPLMALQAKKLGIKIQVDCSHELPPVICDRTMVEQVLLNLARNGMQAMHLDGHLNLKDRVLSLKVQQPKTGSQRLWLNFEVIDCGPGISQEVAQNLFTPFFTTKAEGMGLGLRLCRTVIEQHGGAMEHQPHQPRGTVFRFTLPAITSFQD